MGTAAIPLLRPKDDQGIIPDVIFAIFEICDLNRVTTNINLVAILVREIEDRIVANPLDPMVMDIVIFTSHATPIHSTISARMLILNFISGI